jgi:monovalent cation:proton antiporter-2 (CPA2) family protein
MTAYFLNALIYLVAAMIAVPLARRFGLGSVLGYLIAGVVIGPVSQMVGEETEVLQHFAEFGVVMMLFLVGLELEPRVMWRMRGRLLGLGGLQVAITALAVFLIALAFGLDWRTAIAIGLFLALSSTAIVLQTFEEKGLARTEGGRSGFSVLLFQDMAVIPMLAVIPLLALPELMGQPASYAGDAAGHSESLNLVADLPAWAYALVVVGAIAAVIFGGYYLSRPLFRFVADSGLREIFTATALTLVIGIAALMSLVGLSPALGTFLAGTVLATSEFKHELESNIEPFKGLLLGLFFITVGAGMRFDLLLDNFGAVAAITAAVVIGKAGILYLLGWAFRLKGADRWLLALSLAQAGEFGFVLISFSVQNSVLPPELAQLMALVVTISMFLTPILFIVYERVVAPRYRGDGDDREPDRIEETGRVIIAGIGRFGQIVNRLLLANGIRTVVLDRHAGQIDNMRRVNIKSYFGDATRPDLLATAGVGDAALFIVAIDDRDQAVELVHYLKHTYPQLKVLARAYDRGHLYRLRDAGADHVINETYYSALQLGNQALRDLGLHAFKARQLTAAFDEIENRSREQFYQVWQAMDESKNLNDAYLRLFVEIDQLIRETMQKDRGDGHSRAERGWTPPPKTRADGVTVTPSDNRDVV